MSQGSSQGYTPLIPGLDLISIAQFQAELDERDRLSKEERSSLTPITSAPAAKRQKTTSTDTLSPATAVTKSEAKATGEKASALNSMTQARGLKAEYSYIESRHQAFTASLKLLKGVEEVCSVHTDDDFPSKKLARDVAAGLAVDFLHASDEAARSQFLTAGAGPSSGTEEIERDVDRSQNWVGMLYEHCTSKTLAPPIFEEFRNGLNFGCTCTLRDLGSSRRVFGTKQGQFTSKKDARSMAARAAVMALRENGEMSRPSLPPPQQQEYPQTNQEGPPASPSSAAQLSSAQADPATSVLHGVTNDVLLPATTRVTRLCEKLQIPSPRYTWTKEPQAPAFVSGGAEFVHLDKYPELAGMVGQVRHIFGQKKAREECALKVLVVLEGLIKNGVP